MADSQLEKLHIGIPFEDNYIPQKQPKYVILIPRGKGDDAYWKVIDPINGVAYRAPYDRATQVFMTHLRRPDVKSKALNYTITKKSPVSYRCTLPEEYSGGVFVRVFRYHPIMINEKQGVYEVFRIIMNKDGLFKEDRQGNITRVTNTTVYSPGSMWNKLYPEMEQLEHKPLLPWVGKRKTCRGSRFMGVLNIVPWMPDDVIKKFCTSRGTSCPGMGDMYRYYEKSIRKQHYNTNVPEAVKLYLDKRKPLPEGCHVLMTQTSMSGEWERGKEKEKQCAIFADGKIFFFKANSQTRKWSSSNRRYCTDLLNAPVRKLMLDGKNMLNPAHDAGKRTATLIEDTMLKGASYIPSHLTDQSEDISLPFYADDFRDDSPFLAFLLAQKEYLCAEQAVKMGMWKLAFDIVWRIYLYPGRFGIDKKASLPEVMGITGPQLKFIPKDADISLVSFRQHMELLRYRIPDTNTRIILVSCGIRFSTVQTIANSFDNHMTFFLALVKKTPKEIFAIATEYEDYLRNLRPKALEYLNEEGLDTSILPEKVKPSRVRHVHDTATKFINEKRRKANKKLRQEQNEAIKALKKKHGKKLETGNDNFLIRVPDSADEIAKEGMVLSHCVGSYIPKACEGRTRILFLRRTSEPDKPFLTLELDPWQKAIKQCFGYHDTYNTDLDAAWFIETYARERGFEIQCPLYKIKPETA